MEGLDATTSVLDATHRVLTPEYVEFDFTLAGLFSRFLAWAVDLVIVGAVMAVIAIVAGLAGVVLSGFATAVLFVGWFVVEWGYSIVLETLWAGQTVGKRVMGLRVLQESGVRIGFYQAALRNLARPVDRLPVLYFLGGTTALFSRSHQRLGDLLAGTIVVRERRLKIPSALTPRAADLSLPELPALRGAVGKLSAEERELLLGAAMRREELGLEARLTIFASLARHLQARLDLQRPEHLSDEKWVLLAAQALVARRAP